MALLGPLAALLGIEIDVLMERLRRNATTYALLAVFLAIGGVFLLVAAQVALSMWIGPLWAALALAGAALLIALIIWLSARISEQRRIKREAVARRSSDATAFATTAALTALPLLVRNPALRVGLVPAAAVLGYVLLKRMRPPADSDDDL